MRGDWEGQRGERVLLLPCRPALQQRRGGGAGPSAGGGQGEGRGAQD